MKKNNIIDTTLFFDEMELSELQNLTKSFINQGEENSEFYFVEKLFNNFIQAKPLFTELENTLTKDVLVLFRNKKTTRLWSNKSKQTQSNLIASFYSYMKDRDRLDDFDIIIKIFLCETNSYFLNNSYLLRYVDFINPSIKIKSDYLDKQFILKMKSKNTFKLFMIEKAKNKFIDDKLNTLFSDNEIRNNLFTSLSDDSISFSDIKSQLLSTYQLEIKDLFFNLFELHNGSCIGKEQECKRCKSESYFSDFFSSTSFKNQYVGAFIYQKYLDEINKK